jgi:hypothetical protein
MVTISYSSFQVQHGEYLRAFIQLSINAMGCNHLMKTAVNKMITGLLSMKLAIFLRGAFNDQRGAGFFKFFNVPRRFANGKTNFFALLKVISFSCPQLPCCQFLLIPVGSCLSPVIDSITG